MPVVKGSEIRARRQRLGVKLGPFAAQAGVGYKTLANIECGGQKYVSIEVVHRIASALGMNADDATELIADPEPAGAAA
jgi:transcriptional regulator with XRE-family HTH domain